MWSDITRGIVWRRGTIRVGARVIGGTSGGRTSDRARLAMNQSTPSSYYGSILMLSRFDDVITDCPITLKSFQRCLDLSMRIPCTAIAHRVMKLFTSPGLVKKGNIMLVMRHRERATRLKARGTTKKGLAKQRQNRSRINSWQGSNSVSYDRCQPAFPFPRAWLPHGPRTTADCRCGRLDFNRLR